MKTNKLISTILIAVIAILMVTIVLSSVQAVDAAPKKVKVTWNANGGKIEKANTKITTIKKNAKVGKLLKAPKKTGYQFKGWYTKKTGGKKITTAMKVKKKVIFYAQWKKLSSPSNTGSNRILNANEKKLVGTWDMIQSTTVGSVSITHIFRADGTYSKLTIRKSWDNTGRVSSSTYSYKGSWAVSGTTIYFTNKQYLQNNNWIPEKDSSLKLRFGSDEKGQFFLDDYDRKNYKVF